MMATARKMMVMAANSQRTASGDKDQRLPTLFRHASDARISQIVPCSAQATAAAVAPNHKRRGVTRSGGSEATSVDIGHRVFGPIYRKITIQSHTKSTKCQYNAAL